MKQIRWDFYIMLWEKNPIYKFVKSSSVKWPNVVFKNLAIKQGYNRLQRDNTLVGGYYANAQGDCFLCVPHGVDPSTIY